MNRATSGFFQRHGEDGWSRNGTERGGRLDRGSNQYEGRQDGGSMSSRGKLDHYDNPYRDEIDYQKQRKTRRKEERERKKESRIEAHQQWVAKRREAREASRLAREEKRERREAHSSQKNRSEQSHTKLQSKVPKQTDQKPVPAQPSEKDVKTTTKVGKSSPRGGSKAEKSHVLDKDLPTIDPTNTTTRKRQRAAHDQSTASQQSRPAPSVDTSVATALPSFSTASFMRRALLRPALLEVPIPSSVAERTRRCVNKITLSNVVALTHEVSGLAGRGPSSDRSTPDSKKDPPPHRKELEKEKEKESGKGKAGEAEEGSRAAVLASLLEQVERLCTADVGPLPQTGALPLAGLLRGLQLLHGPHAGADLVEGLSARIQHHLEATAENAAGNLAMVLSYLYLLYGVDAVLMSSLLGALLGEVVALGAGTTTAAEAADVEVLLRRALTAAACALTVLRTCGGKLLKEASQEIERVLREARQQLAGLAQERHLNLVRLTVLVETMGDIVSGHTRKARRAVTESDAPVETMLGDLCEILGQASTGGRKGSNALLRRTQRRIIQTTCMLSGVTWDWILQPQKPPRWYATTAPQASIGDSALDGPSRNGKSDLGLNKESRRGNSVDSASSALAGSSRSASTNTEDREWAQKQEYIRKLRHEEKAIAGQRFNTEHKREVFKAVAAAADDLECFNLLMLRDPTYSRFHDVCAVLIQCCCQETNYNPYYASVLERFCNSKNACQRKLQFALWDRFKGIRIEPVNIATYLNLSCLVTSLLEHGVFTLSLLRGLDLDNINKTIGLLTRVLLLRMLVQLPPKRLTELFFGGDGFRVHDLNTDTAALRGSLRKFMERYFIDEVMANKWLPSFYDVVAAGTPLDVHTDSVPSAHGDQVGGGGPGRASQGSESDDGTEKFQEFMKRIRVAFKALKHGIS